MENAVVLTIDDDNTQGYPAEQVLLHTHTHISYNRYNRATLPSRCCYVHSYTCNYPAEQVLLHTHTHM